MSVRMQSQSLWCLGSFTEVASPVHLWYETERACRAKQPYLAGSGSYRWASGSLKGWGKQHVEGGGHIRKQVWPNIQCFRTELLSFHEHPIPRIPYEAMQSRCYHHCQPRREAGRAEQQGRLSLGWNAGFYFAPLVFSIRLERWSLKDSNSKT